MKKFYHIKNNVLRGLYSVIAAVLLIMVLALMISNIYSVEEEEAYERLHLETFQIKSDIILQMNSDRENLKTMANFASRLHSEGQDYSLLFESFEAIGLFENIGILLPDNTFISKKGTHDVTVLNFEEEILKGEYVSGRVPDISMDRGEVIRSAVPITDENGNTIAMIYGVINLKVLRARYEGEVKSLGAELFVIDGETGDFIIDTKGNTLGNISELAATNFGNEFSYERLLYDLKASNSGYTSYWSLRTKENMYGHYSGIGVGNWQIMLAKPERNVFASAKSTGSYLFVAAGLIVTVMLLYILVVFENERKNTKINAAASGIRKTLLGVNQQSMKIYSALEDIANFAASHMAFFADTMGVDYNYTIPSKKDKLFDEEETQFFISSLVTYTAKRRKELGTQVYLAQINADKTLLLEMPEFYSFLKENDIRTIHCAMVSNSSNNINIIGTINAAKKQIHELLKEIAVCFSMAVFNKKHLSKTEEMAMTDALTGAANRTAYTQNLEKIESVEDGLICVYIDVNELNFYNNQYGHAAGDQMLQFIVEVLDEEFEDSEVYRMGGDEFLLFTENVPLETVKEKVSNAKKLITEMKYNISVGVKSRAKDESIEALVNEAEKLMYIEKTAFYQEKAKNKSTAATEERNISVTKTGNKEVDTFLSVMSIKYNGIYSVSLKDDLASKVLAPDNYFNLESKEHKFSEVMKQYIHEWVNPEYSRKLLELLKYDVIAQKLENGDIPKVEYEKINGERIILSVYMISEDSNETVWMFEIDKK